MYAIKKIGTKIIQRNFSKLNSNFIPEDIYKNDKTKDLISSVIIFKLCSFKWIAEHLEYMKTLSFRFGVSRPFKWILKNTVFKKFCGGEDISETLVIMEKLKLEGIDSILDYAPEPEIIIDDNGKSQDHPEEYFLISKENIKKSIDAASQIKGAIVAVKLSSLLKLSFLRSSQHDQVELNKFIDIIKYAERLDVPLVIDAEQSFIQDKINTIVLQAMLKYNNVFRRKTPLIANTYQMYRKGAFEKLMNDLKYSSHHNFHFSIKLVRGAYKEQEEYWSSELRKESPILNSASAVHEQYDIVSSKIIEEIKNNILNDNHREIYLCAATHNENSISKILNLIEKDNYLGKYVTFAQLFGMRDDITKSLVKQKMKTFKYLPYGHVFDVMSYLSRRSFENIDMFKTNSGIHRIKNEIMDRFRK